MFKVRQIVEYAPGRLIQGNPGDKVKAVSTDSRGLKKGEAFLALRGNNFDGHDFIPLALKAGASCVIAEKKKNLKIPAASALVEVKDTTRAFGNLAAFKRSNFDGPVIAVTGSNGKTTCKEMIAYVLSGSGRVLKNEGTRNNHVGLPQTLIRLDKSYSFAVVEIGTNHFGEVGYLASIARPNIGVITNIGPSHLEFLRDLRGVVKEKSAILDSLSSPGIGLLNADDKHLRRLIEKGRRGVNIFSYGINAKSDFSASRVRLEEGKVKFRFNRKTDFELSTLGAHNVYNALCAIAAGRLLGMPLGDIVSKLADFDFPKGRLKLVQFKGLRFIDDTYNSNPLSLSMALRALKEAKCGGRKILVMGDMLELGRKKELLHRRAAGSITNICDVFVAVGRLASFTASSARHRGLKNIFRCASSLEARDLLLNKISPGAEDIILVKGSRSMKMEEVFKI